MVKCCVNILIVLAVLSISTDLMEKQERMEIVMEHRQAREADVNSDINIKEQNSSSGSDSDCPRNKPLLSEYDFLQYH